MNTIKSLWETAKIITMATEAANGEYEVQWLYNTLVIAIGSKKNGKNLIF